MNTDELKSTVSALLQQVNDPALLQSLRLILQLHLSPKEGALTEEEVQALQKGQEEEQKEGEIESWLKDV